MSYLSSIKELDRISHGHAQHVACHAETANVPLMTKALLDIANDKVLWGFVGAAFQKPSPHCEECGYCEHKGQMLPYGEGQAYEAWQECSLGKLASDRPEMCPALAEHLAETSNQPTENQ